MNLKSFSWPEVKNISLLCDDRISLEVLYSAPWISRYPTSCDVILEEKVFLLSAYSLGCDFDSDAYLSYNETVQLLHIAATSQMYLISWTLFKVINLTFYLTKISFVIDTQYCCFCFELIFFVPNFIRGFDRLTIICVG